MAPKIILIVAMDRNNAIGKGGSLPWRLPPDLARFKELTMGKTVLMGRETYQSIGKALPGRRNMVLTTNPAWGAPNVETFASLDAAIAACTADELWVIGGGKLYEQTIKRASRLELTHVNAVVEGADTWFPAIGRFEYDHILPAQMYKGLEFTFASYAL